MSQVHKENLTAVDNALPNRAGLDIEIFGMEGIPDEIAQQHTQRVLTNYHQAATDRQNKAGTENASKKPKIETTMSLKERLAAHKAAKLAAEQGEGTSSGGGTPQPTTQNLASGTSQYPQHQQPYAAPPINGSYNQAPSFHPPQNGIGYPGPSAYPQPPAPSPSQSTYGQPPSTHPYQPNQPYAQPPQPSFQQQPHGYPQQPAFSPPPYQNHSPFPGQQYSQNGANQYLGPNPGAPRFGSGSPFQQPPMSHVSPTPNGFPQPVRTGSVSLQNAPGLPQRPVFGAPPVSGFQFQQMHQGQLSAPPNHAMQPQYHKQEGSVALISQAPPAGTATTQSGATETPGTDAIDDLIASATKQGDTSTTNTTTYPAAVTKAEIIPEQASTPVAKKSTAEDSKDAKKDGKDKAKPTRLVYSDNDTSPEEKMALMPRYAFSRSMAA